MCINAYNIIIIPWNVKFFFAIVTDCYRPYGFRRRPYIITGWLGALAFTLILAILGTGLQEWSSGVYIWIAINFIIQMFLILADVSADGMSVEIGKYEQKMERGTVLVTGQFISFWFSVGAGILQAFFMNGPDTNPSDCPINASNCWSWGLNVSQFYWFSTVVILVLLVPIFMLKEFDPKDVHIHTISEHANMLWATIQNRTTLYMLIYVGFGFTFGAMTSAVWSIFVYNVIKLTNLQLGISNILSFGASLIGIYIFRQYLLNRNWRSTQYFSFLSQAIFGLLMIFPYNNKASNPWFVIFCGLLASFAQSFCQCLYGLAVIEISPLGQEATTYELIVSSHNAAILIGTLISTQLLAVSDSLACVPSETLKECPKHSVNVTNFNTYLSTGGPKAYTKYSIIILVINIAGTLIFTMFLPSSVQECHQWKERGDINKNTILNKTRTGYISAFIASFLFIYGIVVSILILDPKQSCKVAFGGTGC